MDELDVDCGDCNEEKNIARYVHCGDSFVFNDGVSLCQGFGGIAAVYINNRRGEELSPLPFSYSQIQYIFLIYLVLTRQLIHGAAVRAYCFCGYACSVILFHRQGFFPGVYTRLAEVGLDGEIIITVIAGEVD
jgi:hypothetical protein